MNSNDLKLYLEWDYYAWGEALKYWDSILPNDLTGKKVLELGGRHGGLSLFFARKGATVICSDLHGPSVDAKNLHKNFPNISHEAIDATNIPYEDEFDYIVFKSILGGIGYNENFENQEKCIASIQKALKKDGILLFAENAKASLLHQVMRKHLTKWGSKWNYLNNNELTNLLRGHFKSVHLNSFGFFSIFSRSTWIKKYLFIIDKVSNSYIKRKFKYIVFGFSKN